MHEVLHEPKPTTEDVQYIDYDHEEATAAPATGVGQNDQQLSQELNPKDIEEHLKETSSL